jgi:hypothetical protein
MMPIGVPGWVVLGIAEVASADGRRRRHPQGLHLFLSLGAMGRAISRFSDVTFPRKSYR